MSRLQDLIDNTRTDKNTTHCYLDTYEEKFSPYKNSAKRVLEIGIQRGGSMKLWHDYFPSAEIYGVDVQTIDQTWDVLKSSSRYHLFTSTDGYSKDFIKREFLDKNIKFDIIIDDGPHTLESLIFFTKYYPQILAPGGLLVAEDIQSEDWLLPMAACIPENLQSSIEVVDLRHIHNRWDDLLLFARNTV